jgi:hypothetical protein
MEKAGDILKALLDSKQRQNAAHYSSLFKGWKAMVGPPLEQHSRVKDIINNILIVEVDHPGWMQMLFFKKRQVLGRLKKAYPELAISDMSIRLGSAADATAADETLIPPDAGDAGDADAEAAGNAQSEAEIDEVVAGVEETELKDRLKGLFISALKRGEKAGESGGRRHGS